MLYDYLIIGGGIVGLSTAWQLQQRQPGAAILLLEKEQGVGSHQTGHNSGVIHAGVYYPPGSLKARFCRQGLADTIAFCRHHGIPYEQCGKLLVATSELEQQRMQALYQRAQQNGLEVELLDARELRRREPNVTGLGALFVAGTGIVDYRRVAEKMAREFQRLGGTVNLGRAVTASEEAGDRVRLTLQDGSRVEGRQLVACAGLMADRIARLHGLRTDFRIIPYRGEYYRLRAGCSGIINHLIYPIPDPGLPFLGVHLTRMIDGSVTVGPNAVQGWKREGYGRLNIDFRDSWEMLRFPGFWRATRRHFGTGLAELFNSLWKPGYLRKVRHYCPALTLADLEPCPAGIRAQAVLRDGTLVQDFLFARSPRSLHVCNAPSPAATSAIPIGAHICDLLLGDGTNPAPSQVPPA